MYCKRNTLIGGDTNLVWQMLINKSSILMGKHLYWVVFFCQNSWPFPQLFLVLNVSLVCTLHGTLFLGSQSCKPIYNFFLKPIGVWRKSLFDHSNHISLNSPKWLALYDCFKHMDIEKDKDNSLGFIWASCLQYWATYFCLGHLYQAILAYLFFLLKYNFCFYVFFF